MTITTEYRGYKIHYSENNNKWGCFDANTEADSLTKLKAKIDRMHLQMRKAAARPCVYLGYTTGEPNAVREATAIDVRTKTEKVYDPGRPFKNKEIEVYEIAVTREAVYSGAGGKGREWCKLDQLAPDTEETHKALDVLRQRHEEVKAAEARRREAWKAVPRLTEEDVADLIKAAGERLTEGSDDLVD